MTKEQLRDAKFIDYEINKTIWKIDKFDPGLQLDIGFKLHIHSDKINKYEFFPDEDEKEVFLMVRLIYLDFLQNKLQRLKEEFKNL